MQGVTSLNLTEVWLNHQIGYCFQTYTKFCAFTLWISSKATLGVNSTMTSVFFNISINIQQLKWMLRNFLKSCSSTIIILEEHAWSKFNWLGAEVLWPHLKEDMKVAPKISQTHDQTSLRPTDITSFMEVKNEPRAGVNQSFQISTYTSGERISGALLATSVVTSIRLVIAASLTLDKVTEKVKTLCLRWHMLESTLYSWTRVLMFSTIY